MVRRYPDRFAGVAAVNLEKPVEAVRELERAVRELGFKALRVVPWLWNRPHGPGGSLIKANGRIGESNRIWSPYVKASEIGYRRPRNRIGRPLRVEIEKALREVLNELRQSPMLVRLKDRSSRCEIATLKLDRESRPRGVVIRGTIL
jgi:hypothetical protein